MKNLKSKQFIAVLKLKEGITIGIPTYKEFSNARIVEVFDNGDFTAHWLGNFNLDGDFATELMTFGKDLVQINNLKKRNSIRKRANLIPIK